MTLGFAIVDFVFYRFDAVSSSLHGFGPLYHLGRFDDPVPWVVFLVGYVNFVAARYLIWLLLRRGPAACDDGRVAQANPGRQSGFGRRRHRRAGARQRDRSGATAGRHRRAGNHRRSRPPAGTPGRARVHRPGAPDLLIRAFNPPARTSGAGLRSGAGHFRAVRGPATVPTGPDLARLGGGVAGPRARAVGTTPLPRRRVEISRHM